MCNFNSVQQYIRIVLTNFCNKMLLNIVLNIQEKLKSQKRYFFANEQVVKVKIADIYIILYRPTMLRRFEIKKIFHYFN